MTFYYRPEYRNHLAHVRRKRIVTPGKVALRLNRGERPEPWPEDLCEKVQQALSAWNTTAQQYPSYQGFYQRLAKLHNINPDEIVVGAGIEEFIRTITFLTCAPGDAMVVTWPTCAMYGIYATAFGVHLTPIITKPGQPLGDSQICSFLDGMGTKPKVFFLPNPGQPVETYFNVEALQTIANYCAGFGILFVVDEAHGGFGVESALQLTKKCHNLLVMRTFSKYYAAASIRVGYIVGMREVIQPIEAARPSGEISGPSLVVASVLLEEYEILNRMKNDTVQGRNWLLTQISSNVLPGVKAYGGRGFSVLLQFKNAAWASVMADKLAQRDIYVKAGFEPPVDDCMLVACGSQPLMEQFLTELKAVYE